MRIDNRTIESKNRQDFDEKTHVYPYILDILDENKRDAALSELARRRDMCPNIGSYLWHTYGVVSTLLYEIVAIYPYINPPTLTAVQSQRICGCLTLFQCIANDPNTRTEFTNAQLPLYLYPFLNHPTVNTKPMEFLRLTALGVLGALVKGDNKHVLKFLLKSDIIPLCIKIMEVSADLPRTVSTFILQKILSYDEGLNYICSTPEKYTVIIIVIGHMIKSDIKNMSSRLFKHILRCYLRLYEHPRVKKSFSEYIPEILLDGSHSNELNKFYEQDPAIMLLMNMLMTCLKNEE